MGTDIYAMIEKRNKETMKWELQRIGKDDIYFIPRNYSLFSILANVRNGYGFAGVDLGNGCIPISNPRGVPEDACEEYKNYVNLWGSEEHSHSFFTLAELLNYDWKGNKTKHRGYMKQEVYEEYKRTGFKKSYLGNVFGRHIVKISNEEMDAIINGGPADENASYYTQVEWEESYYESCVDFVENQLKELMRIAEESDCEAENLRIVFGFD